MTDTTAQQCSACSGAGWYVGGDWRAGYPKVTCAVCNGTGRMERSATGEWIQSTDKLDAAISLADAAAKRGVHDDEDADAMIHFLPDFVTDPIFDEIGDLIVDYGEWADALRKRRAQLVR